jgi:hypothetical protein
VLLQGLAPSTCEALEGIANMPLPEVIAADIAADLEAALEQFATIAEDLRGRVSE